MDGKRKTIKCLVWDLDNTLWDGILAEGDDVTLKKGVKDIIIQLDKRGILHSAASKNQHSHAMEKLEEFGLAEYFLVPKINWGSKAVSVAQIACELNIAQDSLAFIDDQPFELAEVAHELGQVMLIEASKYDRILQMPEFCPEFITDDSQERRLMYLRSFQRKEAEESFEGSNEEFLKTLNMELVISPLSVHDLKRAHELTVRTHQLNSTGYSYSYEQLMEYIDHPEYVLKIAKLSDKFGDYGKIGLYLAQRQEIGYMLKLLLLSCRVMNKGIGRVMLTNLINTSVAEKQKLYAEFLDTGRNRMMYIQYKLLGFSEQEENGDSVLFKYEGGAKQYPNYIKIVEE